MAGRPWVGAILKAEKWKIEEVWERNRRRESKTLTRENSHSNEIGNIWKVCFFLYPNAHLLATSYDRPSEWDRVSVRRKETAKPHERRLRVHLSFLVLQFSIVRIIITWKFDLLFWPIVRFYLCHFVLIEKTPTVPRMQIPLSLGSLEKGNDVEVTRALRELFSHHAVQYVFSELTWKARSAEELLSACLHMLMHEC